MIIFYLFSFIDILAGLVIILTSDIAFGFYGKLLGFLILLKGIYSIISLFIK